MGIYQLTRRENVVNVGGIALILLVMAQLFFGSVKAVLFLIPAGILLYRQRRHTISEQKKRSMEQQFRDMLMAISDAMQTGYSIENAIRESYRDLVQIYGYDSQICQEQRLMISRLKLNVNVQTVMEDFAQRTNLEHAKNFADIFRVAKKTGGNMTAVIQSVAEDIALKETVKEEIAVTIQGKKLEQKIMSVIPAFLLIYVSIASPGFLDVMYQTWMGRIIMAGCFVGYMAAFLWSEKITQIDI